VCLKLLNKKDLERFNNNNLNLDSEEIVVPMFNIDKHGAIQYLSLYKKNE